MGSHADRVASGSCSVAGEGERCKEGGERDVTCSDAFGGDSGDAVDGDAVDGGAVDGDAAASPCTIGGAVGWGAAVACAVGASPEAAPVPMPPATGASVT